MSDDVSQAPRERPFEEIGALKHQIDNLRRTLRA